MRLTRAVAPMGQPTKREFLSPEEESGVRAEWVENKRLADIEAAKQPDPTIEEQLIEIRKDNATMREEIDEMKEGTK